MGRSAGARLAIVGALCLLLTLLWRVTREPPVLGPDVHSVSASVRLTSGSTGNSKRVWELEVRAVWDDEASSKAHLEFTSPPDVAGTQVLVLDGAPMVVLPVLRRVTTVPAGAGGRVAGSAFTFSDLSHLGSALRSVFRNDVPLRSIEQFDARGLARVLTVDRVGRSGLPLELEAYDPRLRSWTRLEVLSHALNAEIPEETFTRAFLERD